MGHFANAGSLVVSTLFGLVVFVLVLRVLLQAIRANFYNPICQAMYKATNPLLMPIQKLLKPWRGINTGALLLAWLACCLWVAALLALSGTSAALPGLLVLGFAQLLEFFLQTLFWITMISVLMSWISPDGANPAVPLLYGIADIVLKPLRRVIPPLGGFDLSPVFALLALRLALILLVGPLQQFGISLAR
jgi:YggT family protein